MALDIAPDGCIRPTQTRAEFEITARQPCEHWKVAEAIFTIRADSSSSARSYAEKWLLTGPMHKMVITKIRKK